MNAAIYIRTSTLDQDGQAQLHALRRAAEARGWVSARELIDLGHSGAKPSRPALDELRRAAAKGEVRVVMVAGLDRLGRSLRDLLVLLDELTAAGCAVVSLRESIDLTTPSGRLLVQLIAAMAEFERSLIVERVRSGMARARAQGTRSGKPIGRPWTPPSVISEGLARLAAGERISAVARALGIGETTLRRARAGRCTPGRARGQHPSG